MKNQKIMISVLAWWLILFIAFIAYQEFAISNWTKVRLQTMPVDPNDFFRWDYVVLWYKISDACDSIIPDADIGFWLEDTSRNIQDLKDTEWKNVYISLQNSWDIVVADLCSFTKPSQWLFIKWKVEEWWRITFGIEKYFVQQWSWKDLEKAVWTMKIWVSISSDWQARIVDYKIE